MDLSFENIKTELKELDKDGNAETLKGEVAFKNRDALKSIANSSNGVTRSNTKWRRCEYVIIGIRENETVDDDIALKGWKALAYSHGDQTLILQNEDMSWSLYNSNCEVIGGNIELERLIEKIKVWHNLKSPTEVKTAFKQQIYYGAPGTGKSNEIKKMTAEGGIFMKDCAFRTTFHPDSDYASFVGAYKPYWDKTQSKIVYGFRPQSFLKAYIKAWKNPKKNVALVVEEINRGNCAQIFGDIFQLLDREKNGLSKYPIECDVEMQELLAEEFGEGLDETNRELIDQYYSAHYENAFDKIKNGEILALPMNLSILATMNTSDQSLFPMDSAFKRRWEWIYEPIVEGTKKDGTSLGWKIELGRYKLNADEEEKECVVDWWKFLQKINAVIYSLTSSEDKQLGYFFCQPDNEDGVTISRKLFVGKVVFYLWNEIFKDYAFEHDICKKESKSDTLYFADFYDGKNVIKQTSLVTFFKHLDENQPQIDGKDVKLIEEITTGSSATDIPLDAENKGAETLADGNSEQSEETATENNKA